MSSMCYGRNGSFLASLAALSLLSVASKHQEFRSTNRITFHRTKTLSRITPVTQSEGIRFCDHGTKVSVRDLFGNMPVRVKHRSLNEQTSSGQERNWELLKISLLAYLLSWPEEISLKLCDIDSGRSMSIIGRDSDVSKQKQNIFNTTSPRISNILSQSIYAVLCSDQTWIPASASSRSLSVKGVIGLQPSPSRSLQFITIGILPLLPQFGHNEVYDHINGIFKKSDFGIEEVDPVSIHSRDPSSKDSHCWDDRIKQKDLKICRKGVDRWPMFSLQIYLNDKQHSERHTNDGVIQDGKLLEKTLEVLAALITGWLTTHHFKIRHSRTANSLGEHNRMAYQSSLKRKDQSGTVNEIPSPSLPQRPKRNREAQNAAVLPGGNPSVEVEYQVASMDPDHLGEVLETKIDKAMVWTDPVTNKTHKVNARTGMPLEEIFSELNPKSSRRLTMGPSSAQSGNMSSNWIDDLRKKWKNPVFASAEEPIPYLGNDGLQVTSAQKSQHSHCRHGIQSQHGIFESTSLSNRGKLSKNSLRHARLISQVDNQFILLAVPPESGGTTNSELLVAVDQHAADERVRVERLYKELCEPYEDSTGAYTVTFDRTPSIKHTELRPPLVFQISVPEVELFQKQTSNFLRWGITYTTEVPKTLNFSSERHLKVKTLPTVISERCQSEPELLISTLRSHLWHVAENGQSQNRSLYEGYEIDPVDSPHWLREIGRCPQGILDIVHSRACRSAIMFNDSLTLDECKTLIRNLSTCAFPFQCAHGRPSMAPLVHLEADAPSDEHSMKIKQSGAGGIQVDFLTAFQNWEQGEIVEARN
jgi:DNA mismatch repair protein MLH3